MRMAQRCAGAGGCAGHGDRARRRRGFRAARTRMGSRHAALCVRVARGTDRRCRVRTIRRRGARGMQPARRTAVGMPSICRCTAPRSRTRGRRPELDLVRARARTAAATCRSARASTCTATSRPSSRRCSTSRRSIGRIRTWTWRRRRNACSTISCGVPTGTLKTRRVLRNEGLLLPSFNMRTDAGPMRELEDAARAATTGAIREVGVFGGFPYSDTVHTGASVLVVSDAALDPDGSGSRASRGRDDGSRPAARPAIPCAAALPARSDRLGAGENAAPDPSRSRTLPTIRCPAAAATRPACSARCSRRASACPRCSRASPIRPSSPRPVARAPGGSMEVTLGARYGTQFGEAVTCARNGGAPDRRRVPQHGADGDRRRAALRRKRVLVVDDQPSVRVIVTEQVVPADDPAFYALHGIDPASLRLLCVKAKNHFRAAFASSGASRSSTAMRRVRRVSICRSFRSATRASRPP